MHNIHFPYSFNFAILSKKGVTLYRILPDREKVYGPFGGKIDNAKFVARD